MTGVAPEPEAPEPEAKTEPEKVEPPKPTVLKQVAIIPVPQDRGCVISFEDPAGNKYVWLVKPKSLEQAMHHVRRRIHEGRRSLSQERKTHARG